MASFEKIVTTLQQSLAEFPGDSDLLAAALKQADLFLNDGMLDEAIRILEIGLLHMGQSAYMINFQQHLAFARDWKAARRAATVYDLKGACNLMRPHEMFFHRYSARLILDFAEWFRSAESAMDLSAAEAVANLEKIIAPQYSDVRKMALESISRKIETAQRLEEQARLNKLYSQLNDEFLLVLNDTETDLEKKKSHLETLLIKMTTSQVEFGSNSLYIERFESMADGLKNQMTSITNKIETLNKQKEIEAQQAASKEKTEQELITANKNFSQARSLAKSDSEQDLAEAQTLLAAAQEIFKNTGQLDLYEQTETYMEKLQGLQEQLSKVAGLREQATAALKKLDELKTSLPAEGLSIFLLETFTYLGQASLIHPDSEITLSLIQYARQEAHLLDWTNERIDLALQGKTAASPFEKLLHEAQQANDQIVAQVDQIHTTLKRGEASRGKSQTFLGIAWIITALLGIFVACLWITGQTSGFSFLLKSAETLSEKATVLPVGLSDTPTEPSENGKTGITETPDLTKMITEAIAQFLAQTPTSTPTPIDWPQSLQTQAIDTYVAALAATSSAMPATEIHATQSNIVVWGAINGYANIRSEPIGTVTNNIVAQNKGLVYVVPVLCKTTNDGYDWYLILWENENRYIFAGNVIIPPTSEIFICANESSTQVPTESPSGATTPSPTVATPMP